MSDEQVRRVMSALGRRSAKAGGPAAGGRAAAAKRTPEERKAIASAAAKARWSNKPEDEGAPDLARPEVDPAKARRMGFGATHAAHLVAEAVADLDRRLRAKDITPEEHAAALAKLGS